MESPQAGLSIWFANTQSAAISASQSFFLKDFTSDKLQLVSLVVKRKAILVGEIKLQEK